MFNNNDKKRRFWQKMYKIKENLGIATIFSWIIVIPFAIFVILEIKPNLNTNDSVVSHLTTVAETLYENRIPGNVYQVKSNDSKYEFKVTDTGVEAKSSNYVNTLVGTLDKYGNLSFEVTTTNSDLFYAMGYLAKSLFLSICISLILCWILSNTVDKFYKRYTFSGKYI